MEQQKQSPTAKILTSICNIISLFVCNTPLIVLGFVFAAQYPETSLALWTFVMSGICCGQLIILFFSNVNTIIVVCITGATSDEDSDVRGCRWHFTKQFLDVVVQGIYSVIQIGVVIWGIVVVAKCGDEQNTAKALFIIDVIILCLQGLSACILVCTVCTASLTLCGVALCLAAAG
jgi:hypothetical protein